jgi:spoIIIJ-associated protein
MQDSQSTKKAEEMMKKLLSLLSIDAKSVVTLEKDEAETQFLKISIEGENLGYLIGYRGNTLSSLQMIFNQMFHQDDIDGLTVLIDINNYRKRRGEYLKSLALRAVSEAKESGQNIELPPLAPYERRIIHLFLKDNEGIVSESEGEGEDRHIVIKLKKDSK